MKNVKTGIIFDLDGTLLDTLDDLHACVNYALKNFNYPLRTKAEIRSFVGNGIKLLVKRALPKDVDDKKFQEVFQLFQEYYTANLNNHTKFYPGIIPLLAELRKLNISLGLVSNKFQEGVDKLAQEFFAEYITVAVGTRPDLKSKPAPDAVNYVLRELRLNKDTDLLFYVGDSDVDIETARAAQIPVISVTWGFKKRGFLEALGPDYLVDNPEEILEIIREAKNN
ncbi:MAG: HAD family hydrolase [Bacilli bacterium]